ncbi:hypothetical protein WA171_005755 [Blastocystis sp. BT1]
MNDSARMNNPDVTQILRRICQDLAFDVHRQYHEDPLSCYVDLSDAVRSYINKREVIEYDKTIDCHDSIHNTVQCIYCRGVIENSQYVAHLVKCMNEYSNES